MAKDWLRYDRLVEDALRSVVRRALLEVGVSGLPGDHHFYLTFHTQDPGVSLSPQLRAQYPKEMTIVLQHQFWGLEITEDNFTVKLSFGGVRETLVIPFQSIVSFADPSVKFGLQFETAVDAEGDEIDVDDARYRRKWIHAPAHLTSRQSKRSQRSAEISRQGHCRRVIGRPEVRRDQGRRGGHPGCFPQKITPQTAICNI
jgi:hypothetical protein